MKTVSIGRYLIFQAKMQLLSSEINLHKFNGNKKIKRIQVKLFDMALV